MNLRRTLADALAAALPAYRVMGYATELDAVTRPTVLLWVSLIEPFETFGLDYLKVTFELWVVIGSQDPERANDDADDALTDVLTALQPLDYVDWTSAERGVLFDAHHGYRITAQAVAQIGA